MNARMNNPSDTDRIERSILIKAGRERVWRALTNAESFGTWFGADLKGQVFAPGVRARGQFVIKGHEERFFDALIESIEPQEAMSFRWHPFAPELDHDYSQDEPTLVCFTLRDGPDNATLLTVVETGFDKLPLARRSSAFESHGKGWDFQLSNVANYASQ